MPTPTAKDAKQALYAVAGVADLAVSTIRHLPADAAKLRGRIPAEVVKTYGELVRRGETLVTGRQPHQGGQHPGPPQRRHHPDVGEVGRDQRP